MLNQIQSIAVKISEKLQDDSYLKNLFKHSRGIPLIEKILEKMSSHILNAQESNENLEKCVNFLLKTACEFNLLHELHELLELNILKDINQPILFTNTDVDKHSGNGKTLLGIAAFHGHIEIVKYLIETRLADVNAQDINGDSPLHQVVYGDSFPFNNWNYGTAHDVVAKHLIRFRGNLFLKNNEQKTPYDCTKWCAPLLMENMLGKRFITNTNSALYYADKVRPIFEKELKYLEQMKKHTMLVNIKYAVDQPTNYEHFRLIHAIEEYAKNNKISYGYSNLGQILEALNKLPEKEWKTFKGIISANEPEHFSWKYGLIWDQISALTKKSALIGLLTGIAIYGATEDILVSMMTGTVSTIVAWQILTEIAYKNSLHQRSLQEQRVNHLLQRDRFFQPVDRPQQQSQQLQYIQDELRQLDSDAIGNRL